METNTNRQIVSTDWLAEHLSNPDVAVIDCRFVLGKPGAGLQAYTASHIPGALYFDLEHDLSGPKSADGHGGRHPLPDTASLSRLFSSAGIDETVTVVAYDDQDLAMASRLWWLLRYMGHDRVVVLDGGWQAWQRKEYPVTSEITTRPARRFTASPRPEMLATVEDVKHRSEQAALIDSRAKERYSGQQETIDRKAGHIPGALHYFFKENLTADGTLRSTPELRERFTPLANQQELIIYCGSGVTACVNLLALHQIGRPDARLYLGSWSDWCSYDNPVATGDQP
ncbi:sulfurtransferase [Brevibacillus humidisoli]|uniref:sulfurtransferase n=1 Tax=Brevibacillus humidisoli TaxID=2895522 RepID=UPI001E649672|nr:sulfurtransferase [Brevibacillus humidisoli]UFJ43001.1 sulfurtransferase [Brevibacillus humidisoli]